MKRNLTTKTEQRQPSIRSVHRAVTILTCLGESVNALTDIANCCRLTKPTVYRLLKTMEELLLVTQDPVSHRYYLGPLINQIASNPQASHHYLVNCALEELRHLWDLSGETVELNIMTGLQYIRLFEITSRFDLKVVQGPDPVGPVYVGATAKVLLSQLDKDELRLAIRNIRLSRVTEHSVIDKKQLREQVSQIHELGYGISYGERINGALCLSAPVTGYFWPVALSLIGPEARLKPRMEKTIQAVIAGADRVTQNIKEYFETKGVINYRNT